GARDVFDAAQDICLWNELLRRNKNQGRCAAIGGADSKINDDTRTRHQVMAGVACSIATVVTDQRVVAKPAVEHIIAAAPLEHIVLLVADNLVGPGGPGNVFNADQRVDRNLTEGQAVGAWNDQGFCPSAASAV